MIAAGDGILTARWTELRPHDEQQRLWESDARFRVVPAGRRSGKTELAKRYVIREAIGESTYPDAWYVCAAPTHMQAKRIFWQDLKRLCPPWAIAKISESELTITLYNGAEITVLGLDQPARIEGRSLNGIVLDEYGNMKESVWHENVRPALADRQGWAWLIGVPEGRNHYYEVYIDAGSDPEWDTFEWWSHDILPESEIESMARRMDPLTFDQETKGSFVEFAGRIYYCFDREKHIRPVKLCYEPTRDLIFMFDFNVAPGSALVAQELPANHALCEQYGVKTMSIVIDEVHIPRNSNTPRVCKVLKERYGPEGHNHTGRILCYGDATGGAKGTAKVKGTDWDLIRDELNELWPVEQVRFRVPPQNPKERQRVVAVNSWLLNKAGEIHTLVDPSCTEFIKDLEGVKPIEGTNGEIDKTDLKRTHWSDGWGYFVVKAHPVRGTKIVTVSV